ncbi:hypothetical protein SDC9_209132 [bioreactor metagenome]|uniref:Uncharacterized protein n=1 Tax=bioreactor metagenome TaxID=1076179 RepID=A0A645JCF0_9ZZZZ
MDGFYQQSKDRMFGEADMKVKNTYADYLIQYCGDTQLEH